MSAPDKKDPLSLDERALLRKRVAGGLCAFAPEEQAGVIALAGRGLLVLVTGEGVLLSTGRTLRFDGAPCNIVRLLQVYQLTKAGQDALDWKP